MAYTPVVVDSFGGLILNQDPEEVGLGRPIDGVNFDVSQRGRLRQRSGTRVYAPWDTGTVFTALTRLPRTGTAGDLILAATDGDGIIEFGPDVTPGYGTPVTFTISGSAHNFVLLSENPGSAGEAWFATPTGVGQWNPSSFTSHTTGFPSGTCAGVTPTDQRLVIANEDKLYFSAPGQPDTFDVDPLTGDWVTLDQGDGEDITDIVTWQDFMFVFKETKYYVFYGATLDPEDGKYLPLYHSYRNNGGAKATYQGACAARDGVYFLAADGVYISTGGTPEKVSQVLDPWFKGLPLPEAPSLDASTRPRWMIGADFNRVYVGVGNGSFVMEIDTHEWTFWDLPITAMCTADVGLGVETLLGIGASIVRFVSNSNVDEFFGGGTISMRYQSGASDFGNPMIKVVRQIQVFGTGQPYVGVYTDHQPTTTGESIIDLSDETLDEPPINGVQLHSHKGTFFSFGITATDPGTIHRVRLDVREVRAPGDGMVA